MSKTFGAIPSAYDPRDYSARMMAGAATLPRLYGERRGDLRPGQHRERVMQALSSAPHMYHGVRMGVTFGYGRWRTAIPHPACRPARHATAS